jgi:hypothetical protein
MNGRTQFVVAAAVTLTLGIAGVSRTATNSNVAAAASCKAMNGLPYLGYYGEMATNPPGPYGDTTYAGISCFYTEAPSDPWTGRYAPPVTKIMAWVYDGDSRNAYPAKTYEVRGSLCLTHWDANFSWCSATKYRTLDGGQDPGLTGLGYLRWDNSYPGWSGSDTPPILFGQSWSDTWGTASKIMYVNLPANSQLKAWTTSTAYYYSGP